MASTRTRRYSSSIFTCCSLTMCLHRLGLSTPWAPSHFIGYARLSRHPKRLQAKQAGKHHQARPYVLCRPPFGRRAVRRLAEPALFALLIKVFVLRHTLSTHQIPRPKKCECN
ncbi:hypothetical protein M440DRAFT_178494 [Trichoderma longibrachiatum ATCC 18648]|uniref:Uncharacterized protein n=1 Tax=Trichoderma longibrachiatum ATCC 18648 TaxID=983965 RepID=A0A2T4CER2_TRILO|nr:hypothetical protein M440DRAFT_178494 [Trichoderma longibrachiatum ATCC 18648]